LGDNYRDYSVRPNTGIATGSAEYEKAVDTGCHSHFQQPGFFDRRQKTGRSSIQFLAEAAV
jgi:hypothetical protein